MSAPWWGREATGGAAGARMTATPDGLGRQPQLTLTGRDQIVSELYTLAPAYVAEWTSRRPEDAGVALARLYAQLLDPFRRRLNRYPEKAFVECLRTAGIQPLPARPAEALLTFEVSTSATESVLVAEGFQVGARAADGSGDLVVFETGRNLYAAPAKLKEIYVVLDQVFRAIELSEDADFSFLAFGKGAKAGRAMLIGLDAKVAPTVFLSLGIRVAAPAEDPPPVGLGGLMPLAGPPPPALRWEVLNGTRYEAAEVVVDSTEALTRSGIVELRLPRQWTAGTPEGLDSKLTRWLRVRLMYGQYEEDPQLAGVFLNAVTATAARTIRDEALQAVPGSRGTNKQMQLSQTPVIPGTLVIEVQQTSAADGAVDVLAESETESAGAATRWTAVEDLALYGPEDRVYTLDAESGIVTFGDGKNGAQPAEGFRNIVAVSYQCGGGAGGAVEAGKITTMLSSAPFVSAAKNPLAASGGTDQETQAAAVRRGPQEIRARRRAVALTDYELMAQRAPGADIVRAHAVSGFHPGYPGQPIPGVVGVFVVPPDRTGAAPVPSQGALRAVAKYLSKEVAPAGVEVVVAAPRYYKVSAELSVVIDPDKDTADVVRQILEALDRYLHPIKGGEAGTGWPFGGPIRFHQLMRQLLAVEGVDAVPRMNLVVDGLRVRACEDFRTAPHALLWPEGHEVIPVEDAS